MHWELRAANITEGMTGHSMLSEEKPNTYYEEVLAKDKWRLILIKLLDPFYPFTANTGDRNIRTTLWE